MDDLLTQPEVEIAQETVPSKNATSPSAGPVAHFSCLNCGAEFTVPDAAYNHEPYNTQCFACEKQISIQIVYSQSNMEIIELFGCEYGHTASIVLPASSDQIMNWIESDVTQAPTKVEMNPFDGKETFIDELVSKWIVSTKFGKKIEFEYFSALRNAIEQRVVKAKDKITAPDGKTYQIAEYPGTADLFGNMRLKQAAKKGYARSKSNTFAFKKLLNKATRAAFLFFCAASLTSVGYFAPQYYNRWEKLQGMRVVEDIVSSVHLTGREDFQKISHEAQQMLKTRNPELLPKVVENFQKALALRPASAEIISELSESLTEVSNLTADRLDLKHAQELLAYAKALDPKNSATIRAEARMLWKTHKLGEAINLLEQQPESFFKDPESHFLLAKIAQENGAMAKASVHYNEALQMEPTNITYLLAFADLFESQAKYAQAASYLQKAAHHSDHPELFTARLASLLDKAQDVDSAVSVYKDAIVRNEEPEHNQYLLIKTLMKNERYSQVTEESLNYLANNKEGEYRQDISSIYEKALAALEPPKDQGKNSTTTRRRPKFSSR